MKVAHTVIAGDSRKSDLINSVLSFLSYFIRSGMVQKQQEYRCSTQQDVQEATSLLEQARSKRPYLFNNRRPTCAFNVDRDTTARRGSRLLPSRKSIRSPDTRNPSDDNAPRCSAERPRISRSVSPLKRSDTVKSDLDALMTKSIEAPRNLEFPTKEFSSRENGKSEKYESIRNDQSTEHNEKTTMSGKVKIIVSEIGSRDEIVPKEYQETYPQYPLRNFEKKLDACEDVEEGLATGKTEPYHRLDSSVDPLKMYYSRPELPLDCADRETIDEMSKESQVFFTLGGEDKATKLLSVPRPANNCQCSYTFTRVPSTSAQLPEGVLRKIIQRNFPESSKSIQPPPGAVSGMGARSVGFCLKCNGQGYAAAQNYDGNKQVLETPTNATEVLRTCGSSVGDRNVGMSRSNSLEALMEANSVVELPMPRSVYHRYGSTC